MSERRPLPGSLGRLLATLLMVSLNNGPLAATRLVLPLVAFGFGADKVAVGAMAALMSLVPMLFNVPYGRWIDRAGSLVPFTCAAGMTVTAGTIFVLAPGIPALACAAGLVGAATNFAHLSAARAVIEGSADGQRTRNLGWLLVSHSLFQFLTPLTAGFAYEIGGGRAAMLVVAGSGLLSLVVLVTGYHYYTRLPPSARSSGPRGSLLALLRHPGLAGPLAYSSTFVSVITIFPFVIALHATHVGLTAANAGIVLGAMMLGSLVSRLLAGPVSRLLSPSVVLLAGLVSGAALYAVMPFLTQFWPLMVLGGLVGLSLGFGVPISLGLTYEAAPPGRANEAVGLGQAVTNIQQTVLPLVLGVLAAGPGEAVMIWMISALMMTTVALARV